MDSLGVIKAQLSWLAFLLVQQASLFLASDVENIL